MDIIANYKKSEYTVTVEDIKVRMLVNYLDPSEKKTSPPTLHSHLYAEIFVCLQGELHIQTENGTITLFKGDTSIIPINLPHKAILSNNHNDWGVAGFFIIRKSGKNYSNLYKRLRPLSEGDAPLIFRNVPKISQRIFEICKPLYETNDYLPSLELVGILSNLARLKPNKSKSTVSSQTRMPDIYRMAWFEDLIANRYAEPLTTSKISAMLNISSRQLARILKTHYDMTFHELLIKKRIENAAKFLINTKHSANQISKEVGYTKNSSFYKDFSAEYGITPLEYRNKYSNENLHK